MNYNRRIKGDTKHNTVKEWYLLQKYKQQKKGNTRSLKRVKGGKIRLPNGKDYYKAARGNLKLTGAIRGARS